MDGEPVLDPIRKPTRAAHVAVQASRLVLFPGLEAQGGRAAQPLARLGVS
jgi:hypothetical protein